MTFLQEDLERIAELYNIIESHKEHEYAAPTLILPKWRKLRLLPVTTI